MRDTVCAVVGSCRHDAGAGRRAGRGHSGAGARSGAPAGTGLQTIVLAGGCFWGPQVVYEHVKGVTRALSGYAGGQKATAGNAEAVEEAKSVRVTFDPRQISLGKILQIHFSVAHNPTELNYQGPDVGPQYRSEIFYASDRQKGVAEAYIAQLNAAHVFAKAIVTKVEASPGLIHRRLRSGLCRAASG